MIPKEILQNKNILLMSLSSVWISFVMGFLRWYLPIKLTLMGNPVFAGICFAVANVDDVIFSLLGGVLADRKGRKPIIVFSTLFYGVGTVVLLASLYCEGVYALLFIFIATMLLWGVTGLSFPANSALISESVDSNHVGRAFSTYSIFSNAGTIVGSFTLGILLDRNGILPVAYLLILFTSIGWITRLGIRETLTQKKYEPFSLRETVAPFRFLKGMTLLLPVLVLVISNGLAFGVSGQFFSVYIKEMLRIGEKYIGSIYSIIPILQLISQPIAGYITDKFSIKYALILGNCGAGIFIIVFSLTGDISLALAAYIVSCTLGPFHNIGYSSFVAKISSENYRATLYGSLLSLWNTMFVVGPLLGGILYYLLPGFPFIFAGVILLFAIIPILKIQE